MSESTELPVNVKPLRMAKYKFLDPTKGDVFPEAGQIVQPDTQFFFPISRAIYKSGVSDENGVFKGEVRQEEMILHDKKDQNGAYLYAPKSAQWYLDNYGEGVIIKEMVPISIFANETVQVQGVPTNLTSAFAGREFVLQTTTCFRYYDGDDLVAVSQTLEGNVYVKIYRESYGWDKEAWELWTDITPAIR